MERDAKVSSRVELNISDPGKALLLLHSIYEQTEQPIDDEEFNFIAYILDSDGVLDFSYDFLFEPGPYSSQLYEDLADLANTGYVNITSPISISSKGSSWVSDMISADEQAANLYQALSRDLNILLNKEIDYLFKLAYDKAIHA